MPNTSSTISPVKLANSNLSLLEIFFQENNIDLQDTGCVEYQVINLTLHINALTKHLIANKKDVKIKISLLRMVKQRRHLTQYLMLRSPERHAKLKTWLNNNKLHN